MTSPFDLASLEDLKSWLGIAGTDDDLLLQRLINRTSRSILNYLDRGAILPTVYTECYDGGHENSILLRQWPVNIVLSCSVNGMALPTVDPLGGAAVRLGYVVDPPDVAPPGRMQRLSLRGGAFSCGVQNVIISYSAGYQVTNESAVVPGSSPYEVAILVPHGEFAGDLGVTDANGIFFNRVLVNPGIGQYTAEDGVYTFSGADAGAKLLISYGFVPADLAQCCVEWAAERYQYRARIGQHAKSLGGHETVSFIVKDIPDFVAVGLQPYRRVVMP